eukprot:gene27649-7288_t
MGSRDPFCPRWPKGPVPFLALGGMLAGLTVAFCADARESPGLSQAYQLGIILFKSDENLQFVMKMGVLAHVIEAAYVLYFCLKKMLDPMYSFVWVSLTLLLGYPAIAELHKCLKAAWAKEVSKEAMKKDS